MILLNFAHPLTPTQQAQIEERAGQKMDSVRFYPLQFDPEQDFASQVRALVQQVNLSPQEWQGEDILVNPPTLSILAVTLLAELHGRIGHFPAVIRLKATGGPVTQFELAEIINLDEVRSQARKAR